MVVAPANASFVLATLVPLGALAAAAGVVGSRTTPAHLPTPDWTEAVVEGALAAVVGISLGFGALALTPSLGIALLHIPTFPGFLEGEWERVPPLAERLADLHTYHVLYPAGAVLVNTLANGFLVAIAVLVQRRFRSAASEG